MMAWYGGACRIDHPVSARPDTGYNSDPYFVMTELNFVFTGVRSQQKGRQLLKVKMSNDGITWSDSVACTIDAGGMRGVNPMFSSIIRHKICILTLTFQWGV